MSEFSNPSLTPPLYSELRRQSFFKNLHVGEFGCGNSTKSFLPLSNICKKEARDRSSGRNSVVYSMTSGHMKNRVKAAAGSNGEGLTYKDSGVDIDAASELVRRIAKMASGIGGFGELFPLGDSYLVAATDGVRTKLKLAFETGIRETVKISGVI